jgi:hypothetical protein
MWIRAKIRVVAGPEGGGGSTAVKCRRDGGGNGYETALIRTRVLS